MIHENSLSNSKKRVALPVLFTRCVVCATGIHGAMRFFVLQSTLLLCQLAGHNAEEQSHFYRV